MKSINRLNTFDGGLLIVVYKVSTTKVFFMIISTWGLYSIETRQFLLYRCHENNASVETNVQEVSFWDKNADLQELRLRQDQTFRSLTKKNVLLFSKYRSGLFEIFPGVLPCISHIAMAAPKGRIFGPFWSEWTGIYFAHFFTGIGYSFRGTYERICRIRSGF